MNNSSKASKVVTTGQVQAGIARFNGEIHHRVTSQKENAVNGNNVLKTPSSKRVSRLRPPTSASQRSAGMANPNENMLVTPSRRLSTPSTLNTPAMANLMEELNSNLDRGQEELLKAFKSNTDMLADISTKGFKDVNRTLALQHSSQLTHYRNSDRKMDRMLSEMEQLLKLQQQLSARKELPNIPSSITASTGTSSAMTSVRSILFSNEDVARSTGNSTHSRVCPDVLPSMTTTKSQHIDTMKLEQQLKESHEVIAVLENQNRSKDVKMEQQEKRLRSLTLPPGHRDVMDIKPTPTQHSERTNQSVDKAIKTARRGNRNRDITPSTRRSTRTRRQVQKDP